jgi:hypothetical protein
VISAFSASARSLRAAFSNWAMDSLLDHFVDDGEHVGVGQDNALIHFFLLHCGKQQPHGAQARAVLGAHRRFHVFGDFVFQAHGFRKQNAPASGRGVQDL